MAGPLALCSPTEVMYDPHEGRQTQALTWMLARIGRPDLAGYAGNVFLYGNRGGGKSKLVRNCFHMMALAFPGLRYVIVRRNYPDLNKNHLIYVGREMRQLNGTYLRSIRQANYDNGSIGMFHHCESEADVEKIVGAEAALLFVDEAPQIAWSFLRMMVPSLRIPLRPDGSHPGYRTLAVLSGNPAGESIDEIWQYHIEKTVDPLVDPEYRPDDFHAIELRLEDNPSLDPLEYRKQFAGLPEHIRKAWLDGTRMESRTLFNVKPTRDGKPYHYIQELPTIDGTPLLRVPWVQVYRAFDMGFHPDPAVCLWLVVVGRRVIAVHERTWSETIARDLATGIVTETTELFGREVSAITYADPKIGTRTGSDTVTVQDVMEIHGVPIECSINDRILYADAIHGLLGEEVEPGIPRLQIYEPGCPKLCRYLPKMRWDEHNPRKMADHVGDHWPVALAYFAISSGVLAFTEAAAPQTEPVWMSWIRERQGAKRRRHYGSYIER